MALGTIVVVFFILGAIADAAPTITFPINSQVPPVARIGEPFSYAFSISTFSSSSPITYALSDAPRWLSLDSGTRTLSGTPAADELGTSAVTGINIELTASDQLGSVTLNTTLVVSRNPAPSIGVPLSAQLASLGTSSLPQTVLYHPSTNFDFKFDSGTFSPSGLNYYAITQGNTPLPSWIQFDSSSLSFTGRTPDYQSLIQPPQTFDIQLIASDVEGFSAVSIPFAIEVGVHLLAFKNANMVINVTAGSAVNFEGLQNNLQLDGTAITTANLASITVQAPDWLTFDNSTLSLSGTVPEVIGSSNITVQARDVYGDTESAVIIIQTAFTDLFSSQIGSLNVSTGSPFSFNFSSHVRDPSNVEMTAQFSPVASWIDFDSQSFVMSGTVPLDAPDSKISVTLGATSKFSHASTSQTFDLFVAHRISDLSSSSSSTTASSSPTNTQSTASNTLLPSTAKPSHGLSSGTIVAIALPLSLLAVAVILAFCCYHRRRAAGKRRPRSPAKSEISGPTEMPPSVMEIVLPPHTVTPKPLQLDTSGFTTDLSSSTYTSERDRSSRRFSGNPLRRSQTMSAVPGQLNSEFRHSNSMGARAYSDNALSRTDTSRRSTQNSSYPALSSSSHTKSSHRLTRNYSRKGQRYSGRIKSRDSALRNSNISTQRPQSTLLNLADSNFSFTHLDNYSVLSKRTSAQSTSEVSGSLQHTKSQNRKSRFMPGVDPRIRVEHGMPESIASLAGLNLKRASVVQSQNWETVGIPRDSRTWLEVSSPTQEHDRLSNISGVTEDTDVLDDQVAPLSLRSKDNARIPASRSHSKSSSTRPVSRRAIGFSPFFAGGGSMKSSRKSPGNQRTSWADSPTVPEEDLVDGMGDLREGTVGPRGSFGITYGHAREGTRQLKSYIQNRLQRTKTADSVQSSESRGSRVESADSLQQSYQPNFVVHALSPDISYGHREILDQGPHEEYLPESYSDESWETQHSPPRDSLGNIIDYGLGEDPEIATAVAQRHGLVPGTALSSHPASPMPPDLGPNARMVSGRGKRPLSVDAGSNNQGSVRAVVEGDYTAYI